MPINRIDIRLERSYLRLLLGVSLVAFTALLGWLNGLGRLDQLIYDRAISLINRPAPTDVLIVTIDDSAINTLGRWPWPRSLHAMLLERLQTARAVGLDIVFSESNVQRTEDDRLLVNAVQRHGRVVLPIVLDNLDRPTRAELPLASLAQAAAGLGYINVDPDDDGVLRRTTWARNTGNLPWHQFALTMLEVGGDAPQVRRFLPQLPPDATTLIPYAGPPGHFQSVSYLAVLRGQVPPEAIKDKYVIVGAWATGLGDVFPSPVSHNTSGIQGVEVIANLLQAAREGSILVPAQTWQTALAGAIPVLLLCLALPRLSPRQAILCSAALLGAILVSTIAILFLWNIWIPPTAALLGVALSYPIWSWRSQEAALRYMSREMKRLRVEYPPVLDETTHSFEHRIGRSLDHHVHELDRTLTHVRNLRRFVEDGLDGMPDATMVIDKKGRLQYKNRPADVYFVQLGIRLPRIGQTIAPALEQAFIAPATRQTVRQALLPPADNDQATDGTKDTETAAARTSVEVRDRAEHDLLIRCAPIRTAQGAYAGMVVTLSDISTVRQAERQREETLRFISHDMRAPQNSILALVELATKPQQTASGAADSRVEQTGQRPAPLVHDGQQGATDHPPAQTLTRIAHLANRTLRLVDDFIQLNRAESMSIARDRLDLVAMLHEISDDFWAAAQARAMTLDVHSSVPVALAYGDSTLILRALSNLIDNALKYSADNSTIHVRLSPDADTWAIDIQDTGPGIAVEDQARLFEPFFRTKTVQDSTTEGSGLGLAFVHAVAQRHGGSVTLKSELGVGSRFTFRLPVGTVSETDA
ncbi:CHASE2 domain-containing protein [Bordetella muralis]|uniref:CHASE2 domain-containing protein n=1 Tax=Bordetella muralis TaxID=1649130 RepID=UPI0039F146DD